MAELKLTSYELETVINSNLAEKTAIVYTLEKPMMRRIQKIIDSGNAEIKVLRQTEDMLEVEIPKKWIKIRPPRQMSEEQRAAAVERMKNLQERRKAAMEAQDDEDPEGEDVDDDFEEDEE